MAERLELDVTAIRTPAELQEVLFKTFRLPGWYGFNPGHYLIQAKKDTTLRDYQEALADTREDWKLVPPEDGS
ncbi:MAG: hypothetical protein JWO38_6206 [Gemmataceae bacterium]|nr:hypothetical protein [Gemmataceae bacterium]